MDIALIGGGRAAVTILDRFAEFDEHRIVAVCDLDPEAPGMQRARALGVATATDIQAMLAEYRPPVILELTGHPAVQARLRDLADEDRTVVMAQGVKLLCDLMDSHAARNRRQAEHLSGRFDGLRLDLEGAIGAIDRSSTDIGNLLREATVISMNASIEAARSGEAGRGFTVIVERMSDLVAAIRTSLGGIEDAAAQTRTSVRNIHGAERHLLASFQAEGGGG